MSRRAVVLGLSAMDSEIETCQAVAELQWGHLEISRRDFMSACRLPPIAVGPATFQPDRQSIGFFKVLPA